MKLPGINHHTTNYSLLFVTGLLSTFAAGLLSAFVAGASLLEAGVLLESVL
jgi:hypothetical protein